MTRCAGKTGPFIAIALLWMLILACPLSAFAVSPAPAGFVDLHDVIPSVVLDIRYYTAHNFVGERVDGYNAPKCIITKKAADALAGVQKELMDSGLSLKVYDCYRPQRAVSHFVRWAKDIGDTRTKKEFYPTVDKRDLFRDGYIAERSGHSRGSTIDLTIVPIPVPAQEGYIPGQTLHECWLPAEKRFKDNGIDMGTGFDCFHELSHTANREIGETQRINRLLLKTLMEKHGFVNYDREWWHYTLKGEPYPDTYFDFVIE
jgi:D-alanyl-D-alanine dipeptidase